MALLDCLRQHCGFSADWGIADVGSGTGLLAEVFLKHGNRVFGVEPNAEMRGAGETFLRKYPGFSSVAGSAEATGLDSGSIDLIAAGQAFHWFDRERTRQEFERILKPGGWIALVWNERLTNTPFLAAYEEMVRRYSPEYEKVDHRQVTDEVVEEFFRPGAVRGFVLPNYQEFDLEGLQGRLLSSSYVPLEGEAGHGEMLERNEKIFREYEQHGRVRFEYDTKLYCGRLG